MLETKELAGALAPIVREYAEQRVADALAPLIARIAALETRELPAASATSIASALIDREGHFILSLSDGTLIDLGNIVGRDADPATIKDMVSSAVADIPAPRDGISVDMDAVGKMVTDAVAALPPAKDGDSIAPDEVRSIVAAAVASAVADLPKPADGESVTVEDLSPIVAEAVRRAVDDLPVPRDGVGLAGAMIDRAGDLVVTLADGSTRELGRVVGADVDMAIVERRIDDAVAAWPKPRDGFGLDDFDIEAVDERTIKLMFVRGDTCHSFELEFPVMIYRGVWEPGEYHRGDTVTWGGSLWHADRITSLKPDAPESGWRLAVKKGRDAKAAAK